MTDLAIYQPSAELAVPGHRDIDSWINVVQDVIKIANVIYDTPFVPDGLRGSAPAVAAAILAGREMGLGMMTSLANIDVIKGKPSQKALLMRAMILSKGHKWQDGDVSDTRAVVRGCRKGESEWLEVIFTADQAKRAGIDLGKYPADKLYARATSRLARRKFADVIMGIPYSPEDLEDGGEDGEVGPAAEVRPEPAKPAQRTARRARAAQSPSPAAEAATPPQPAAPSPPARTAAGEAPQPPLPGEDEPDPTGAPEPGTGSSPSGSATGEPDERDYDSPGTVTTPQITAIWTVLSKVFSFGSDEKDNARAVCAYIVERPLGSTKEMSKNEAKAVLDTLALWRDVAGKGNMTPREYLTELMAAVAGDAPEPGDG